MRLRPCDLLTSCRAGVGLLPCSRFDYVNSCGFFKTFKTTKKQQHPLICTLLKTEVVSLLQGMGGSVAFRCQIARMVPELRQSTTPSSFQKYNAQHYSRPAIQACQRSEAGFGGAARHGRGRCPEFAADPGQEQWAAGASAGRLGGWAVLGGFGSGHAAPSRAVHRARPGWSCDQIAPGTGPGTFQKQQNGLFEDAYKRFRAKGRFACTLFSLVRRWS